MLKSLRTFLVLLNCLLLCVGGNGLFQMVAWGRMLVDYSASAGFSKGVAMTFDGQHPCCMCKAIAENSKQQKENGKESPALAVLKSAMESLLPSEMAEAILPDVVEYILPEFVPAKVGHSIAADSPPLPPPQGFRA